MLPTASKPLLPIHGQRVLRTWIRRRRRRQLISFTAERDAGGTCTAAWQFSGDFQAGDQLRLFWRGTAVAEGQASATDQVMGSTGFDEMWLVRGGQTVQIWQPSPSTC